ncbi:hypothetical protein JB92DRAFT_3115676 [Gautieria morchelliformis]|nr:hypothetical protein JB92DRAFT_3115676 [Gautieria morchelliformis]
MDAVLDVNSYGTWMTVVNYALYNRTQHVSDTVAESDNWLPANVDLNSDEQYMTDESNDGSNLGEQPDTVSVESEGSVSVESEDSMDETDSDQTTHKAAPQPYPPASTTFIELRHHPHSGILEPEFIFWDLPSGNLVSEQDRDSPQQCYNTAKPWAPFRTQADFEFSEIAIQSAMHTDSIKRLIMGIKHNWTDPGHSRLTFQDINDFHNTMGFARKAIRNGSGNGGAVLIGYMPRIVYPGDPDDRTQKEKEGEAVKCGDEIHRVFFPGIAIQSLDMEEAACACGMRAASADYPCTRCLVHKHQLQLVTKSFTLRTTKTMQSVYKQAINAHTKAASEDILKKNGLHKVLNTFWFIANSDPYIAHSYDLLHNDDSGKFWKHLFPLTIEVLGDLAKKGKYSQNMNMVPSWPNLNHFQSITTMEFSDGQSYFDALKCILPCIVQLLPANSPLIHCLRAYACIRLIAGLHMISELQLNKLQEYLQEYEDYCKEVQELYGKIFNFPKQHALVHLTYDIIHKGSTINYNTRVGEGFQQEAKQAYHLTNFKNVEEQMTRIDENQEAIARIRMAIDAYEKELKDRNAEAEEEKKAQHNTQAAQP